MLRGLLEDVAGHYPDVIVEVRGRGLMLGIKTALPSPEIVEELRARANVLTPAAGDNVTRVLPPLIVTDEEIRLFVERWRGGFCLILKAHGTWRHVRMRPRGGVVTQRTANPCSAGSNPARGLHSIKQSEGGAATSRNSEQAGTSEMHSNRDDAQSGGGLSRAEDIGLRTRRLARRIYFRGNVQSVRSSCVVRHSPVSIS